MQGRKVIQAVFFVLFFSIGAASLSSSILCDDLIQYYQNKQFLRAAQKSLDQLKSLNADYDVLLERLEEDPNLVVERLATATLGTKTEDANTVYPRARSRQLAAARKALMEESNGGPAEAAMPQWLRRCSEPRNRILLFVSGVVLVLISFVCFRPAKRTF
ncbi:MAG TPA: hypothetical protein VMX36_06665 [Sedimentisphaerales bacterium]|nr:hypothetical protein [Sedimentisphaerales bacterium]